jgi:hypothetical protein
VDLNGKRRGIIADLQVDGKGGCLLTRRAYCSLLLPLLLLLLPLLLPGAPAHRAAAAGAGQHHHRHTRHAGGERAAEGLPGLAWCRKPTGSCCCPLHLFHNTC